MKRTGKIFAVSISESKSTSKNSFIFPSLIRNIIFFYPCFVKSLFCLMELLLKIVKLIPIELKCNKLQNIDKNIQDKDAKLILFNF